MAGAVAVYYALPDAWLKVAWGVGAGAAIYLALVALARLLRPQPVRDAPPLAVSARRILERCDALARFSEEEGLITRWYGSRALVQASDAVAAWMEEAGLAVRRMRWAT